MTAIRLCDLGLPEVFFFGQLRWPMPTTAHCWPATSSLT